MGSVVGFNLLLFFCFFGLISSTCLNDCSEHGQCGGDDVCVCESPWSGSDCSVYNQYLNSGDSKQEVVGDKEWRYFRHSVESPGVDLVWWLNETSSLGDCDLYLNLNNFPTKSYYTQRNLSTFSETSLIEKNAKGGMHFAGIFGFQTCSFSILVYEAGCTQGCVHGTCQSSECVCDEGFIGEQCEFSYEPLVVGQSLHGTVEKEGWNYYYSELNQGDHVIYKLEDDAGGDCDMYLRYHELPEYWAWDMANVSIGDVSTIEMNSAHAGTYYLGVQGFNAGCTFVVSLDASSSAEACPSRCSNHGSCTEDRECECHPGYDGGDCEWRTAPLHLSTPVVGYVGEGGWNYYNVRVITDNSLVVRLTQVGEEGDCDLYMRKDDKPSNFEFDYVDVKTSSEIHIVVRQPGEAVWYIGVYGFGSCSYSLVVSEEVVCDCGIDNPHGECGGEGGEECVCEEGWGGEKCDVELKVLASGVVREGDSVDKYFWKYYKFEVEESSTGIVSLRENNSVGMLWLYVSFRDQPALWNYDLVDNAVNTAYHEISVTVPNPQTRTLYVGVYGSPFSIHGEALDYDLVAWASPF